MQMNLGPTFQVPFSFETRENSVRVTKWHIKRSTEGEYYMLMGESEGLSLAQWTHLIPECALIKTQTLSPCDLWGRKVRSYSRVAAATPPPPPPVGGPTVEKK